MSVFELLPAYRYQSAMPAARDSRSVYPAYNIEAADDDRYRVALAVPGFTEEQLSLEVENQRLTVTGQQGDEAPSENAYKTLHHGIARRDFVRRFELAEHVEVVDAKLDHGVLVVNLVKQVPDASKPRRIAIDTAAAAGSRVTEDQAA